MHSVQPVNPEQCPYLLTVLHGKQMFNTLCPHKTINHQSETIQILVVRVQF